MRLPISATIIASAVLAALVTAPLPALAKRADAAHVDVKPHTTPPGIELYEESLHAADYVPYAGHQYITTWSDDGESTTVVTTVYHQPRFEFLQKFTSPKSRAGREILENESYQWTFVPHNRVIIQSSRLAMRDDEPDIALLLKNYSITVGAKPEKIAGRDAYIVTLTSKTRKEKAVRYWIDTSTALALRSERYHADGDLAAVTYFSDINFHPKFDASAFSPEQWPNTRVERVMYKTSSIQKLTPAEVASALGGNSIAPDSIREFHLSSVTRLPDAAHETLHLHYSDGLTSLSVFETIRTNKKATRMDGSRPMVVTSGRPGRVAARYNYSILNFDTPKNSVTFLGDLSPETLADLASSFPSAGK